MKYRDLIEFDPIETVIQLRSADRPSEAETLVRTFVISNSMAEDLVDTIFADLQYMEEYDHRGLLIVGNYGTGKSHLMALITSIAENDQLVQYVRNQRVRDNSENVAGRFKVIRSEIGAVRMGLRDIVLTELEKGLTKMGVQYKFPGAEAITNNKDSITEMMIEFGEKYPDKGLLFALDELLDYLRQRSEKELVQDLIFLRELGEVCKETRFRFIAGVQEAVFDSPSFQFASDSLRRVKDRFQEVFIKREDVEFVISERLLRKTPRQRDLIRKHLEKFAPYYTGISEKLDHYVSLFPVHPYYIEMFEQIRFVEKREILKTLSKSISKLLDGDVPHDVPGVLTYDMYWENVKNDSSFKAKPEVSNVREKSEVLENKMNGFPRPNYKPIALQLIHALSVHRLTTDIKVPIGTTAEELRDQLFVPFPPGTPDQMKNEEDLKGIISTILALVMQTVSGQYLSFNKENGQYHIDVEKDVDYDQLIKDRADSLDDETYDVYYYDALANLMECSKTTYVSGFKIWEHEVHWTQKNTTRLGYLFFGEPNSRSTAQPPRDFYLYFLPFFDVKPSNHVNQLDEVFLRLVNPAEELVENIKLYSGARELERRSTVGSKEIFRGKAEGYLRSITQYLYGNTAKIFEVIYKTGTEPLVKYLKQSTGQLTFKEIIDNVASECLSTHFNDQAPEYPCFGALVTGSNREQVVRDALRALVSESRTKLGTTILEGLKLMDGGVVKTGGSVYAKHVRELLDSKGEGVVLNRSELVKSEYGVPYETKFRLESELLVVVLAALVRDGLIEMSVSGNRFTAANLDELARAPVSELVEFKHIQKPKGYPIETLKRLFKILGLNMGLLNNQDYLDDAVLTLQSKVAELIPQVVEEDQRVKGGLQLMGVLLFSEEELKSTRENLDALKQFLESLQKYNTTGRLRNCRYSTEELDRLADVLEIYQSLVRLERMIFDVNPLASYLSGAESVLPSNNEWVKSYRELKERFTPVLHDKDMRMKTSFKSELIGEFKASKKGYVDEYYGLHRKSRLDADHDSLKGRIIKDPLMERLNRLGTLDLLPINRVNEFHNNLAVLKPCFSLTRDELESVYVCPHCGYRPVEEVFKGVASALLIQYEEELETINGEWDQVILDNLRDPMVQQAMDALKPSERAAVDQMLDSGKVPEKITNEFLSILKVVFTGLVKVQINRGSLVEDLTRGGMPCTVDEYQKRFEEHLKKLTQGKEKSKIRIILEE